MSTNSVCRVCLVDNLDLHSVRNDFQNLYERLSGEKYNEVGYPVRMCYICLTVLTKCHRFMETARDTNNMLKQWYNQQNEMRVSRPLYTYSINKAESVYTYKYNEPMIFKHEIKVEPISMEDEEEHLNPDYAECSTDVGIVKTDVEEQPEHSELVIENPNDVLITTMTTYSDSDEDNDRPIDPLFNNETATSFSAEQMQLHDSVLSCDVCFCRFGSLSSLNSHKAIEHKIGGTKIFLQNASAPNLQYNQNTTNKYLISNIKSENEKQFSCHICGYTNKQKAHMRIHIRTHTGDKPFSCHICDLKFTQKGSLGRHMRTHTGDKLFSCHICDYKCHQRVTLNSHIIRNHTIEKPFSCDVCDYKCKEKRYLITHMTNHTGQMPFANDIYDNKNIEQGSLVADMRTDTGEVKRTVPGGKVFECQICEYKCNHKGTLTRHMAAHISEKRFACEMCDYKCNQKSTLKRHMRTHSSEKPYTCEICRHGYRRKSYLKVHMRTHTGSKPFSCNVCEYKCTEKGSLKIHMRIHTGETPYACEFCDYRFKQKCTLATHMKTHTGEKPFLCHICSHRFIRKGDLRIHMRIHTGEKPYACDICDYKCNQKANLTTHMRTHTGERPVGDGRDFPQP